MSILQNCIAPPYTFVKSRGTHYIFLTSTIDLPATLSSPQQSGWLPSVLLEHGTAIPRRQHVHHWNSCAPSHTAHTSKLPPNGRMIDITSYWILSWNNEFNISVLTKYLQTQYKSQLLFICILKVAIYDGHWEKKYTVHVFAVIFISIKNAWHLIVLLFHYFFM